MCQLEPGGKGDQSHQAWKVSSLDSLQHLAENKQVTRATVQDGARQMSLKSRAWYREWVINSGRSRRITKHHLLQKNVSQGTLSSLLKISPQGPFCRSIRSRWILWTEEKISTCSTIRIPYVISQWSQRVNSYGLVQEEDQVLSSASRFSFKLVNSNTAYIWDGIKQMS